MIQKIGGLYTRVMARIIPAREVNKKEDHPKGRVNLFRPSNAISLKQL